MKYVKNRTGMACFLACIESFLADNGIELKQEEMIRRFSPKGYCQSNGAMNTWYAGGQNNGVATGNESKLCRELGIEYIDVDLRLPIDPSYQDGSLLITTHENGEHHCIRYGGQENDGRIIAMDPDDPLANGWSMERIIEKECKFHRIRMRSN